MPIREARPAKPVKSVQRTDLSVERREPSERPGHLVEYWVSEPGLHGQKNG
jgi:hypothetical protein